MRHLLQSIAEQAAAIPGTDGDGNVHDYGGVFCIRYDSTLVVKMTGC